MEEHRLDMKPSGSTVSSSIALILENTCWTVISPWRECDFYFLFFFHATHSGFFLHWEITNSLKLSTQLSLQECTVSEPCRLLDIFFSPLLLSLPTFGFIYIFCYFVSSSPWLSLLHLGQMPVTEHYTSYHGRQARCRSKELRSCELPIYIAEVTFYTKRAIAVIYFFSWMDNELLSHLKGCVCVLVCMCLRASHLVCRTACECAENISGSAGVPCRMRAGQ